MSSLRPLLRWVRRHRRKVYAGLCATVANVAVSLLIPLQLSRIIDDGIGGDDLGVVGTTTLRLIVVVVASFALSTTAAMLAVRTSFWVMSDLRSDLYRKIQTLSFAELDRWETGGLLVRLTSDMTKVQTIIAVTLSFAVQAPLMLVGALVAMLSLQPSLAAILIVILPLSGGVIWFVTARAEALYDAVQRHLDRLNTVLRENLAGARVVKAFVNGRHERRRFAVVNDKLVAEGIAVNELVAVLLPALLTIANLAVAFVLWRGGNRVIAGDLTDGELVAFINYLLMASMPTLMLAIIQPMFAAASASMERVVEVMDTEPAVASPPVPVEPAGGVIDGRIEFDHVSFSYDGEDVLCDVSFVAEPGCTVAILGATGSGKSTLTHLIPRYYDTCAGRVLVGGHDVRDLDLGLLRRSVAVAMQQPVLFAGTIADNLRYGRRNATDTEIREAAVIAQAHDFITELPDGYDARLEASGANLSGGQRQRLSIARALVVDAPILVLDDSTSALDAQTEARFRVALDQRAGQRTTILVAQRISSVLSADRIVLLNDGRVDAVGDHATLIGTNELYRDIFRSQLGEPEAVA